MGRLSLISPLKARHPEEAHRVTTQLELFFDLISVIAISAATRIVFEGQRLHLKLWGKRSDAE
jgi:low temperature requirement protein LtrA